MKREFPAPRYSGPSLSQALRALNEAAYAAGRAARSEKSPLADELKRLALRTDEMVDAQPSQPATQEATA